MAWVLPVVVVVDGGTSHQEMENYKNIPLSLSASSPYVCWMSSSLDTAFPVL